MMLLEKAVAECWGQDKTYLLEKGWPVGRLPEASASSSQLHQNGLAEEVQSSAVRAAAVVSIHLYYLLAGAAAGSGIRSVEAAELVADSC